LLSGNDEAGALGVEDDALDGHVLESGAGSLRAAVVRSRVGVDAVARRLTGAGGGASARRAIRATGDELAAAAGAGAGATGAAAGFAASPTSASVS
jgi:hypothetical protein